MRVPLITLAAVLSVFFASEPLLAKHKPRTKAVHSWQKSEPRADRDCVPINGRFGYYGNPWCDTGSSRPPDIDFRERHRSQQR
ncbi:MAG TPA: hypothetical protein PKE16_04595 [Hyphomicrobium sp.]|nr:hypothetical protein [Hyphomicrobium sp.]